MTKVYVQNKDGKPLMPTTRLDAMRHNEPRNLRWSQCRVEGPFIDL